MSPPPVALLAGATGAVGARLLARLLERGDGTRVVTIGRRPPAEMHARLVHIPAEIADFSAALSGTQCTEAFCCLGTTLKTAGSRAAFRAVDVDGVAGFAAAARLAGAGFFGLVSSAGADPQARNFYLRSKGEAEHQVEAQGFPSLAILRPGLLRGERKESRPAERVGQMAAPLFDRLLIGRLAQYRSVTLDAVAAALDQAARARRPGLVRLDSVAIEAGRE